MSELIEKLGVDWKLLAAQAVNFLVLLLVLRFTVYKPLLRITTQRQRKIKKGLDDAQTASKHLGEVEAEGRVRFAEIEKESLAIIARAENKAKLNEEGILEEARTKEADIIRNAERMAEAKKTESQEAIYREAVTMIKAAVVKTAGLAPHVIDDSLVEEGLRAVKKITK